MPALWEMRPSDRSSARAIHAESLETPDAGFETDPPSWPEWERDVVLLDRRSDRVGTDG